MNLQKAIEFAESGNNIRITTWNPNVAIFLDEYYGKLSFRFVGNCVHKGKEKISNETFQFDYEDIKSENWEVV